MNLLEETIAYIEFSNHKPGDIVFIGSLESGHSCTWPEFKILADIEYAESSGGQEIASDLVIVFSDNLQMWRDECDGSEKWACIPPADIPRLTRPIKALTIQDDNIKSMWDTLDDIHWKLAKYEGPTSRNDHERN